MKKLNSILMCLILFVMAIALSSIDAEAAKVTVSSVKVKAPYNKTIEVAKGKSVKITPVVTVKPNKSANKKVTFTSKNKQIATVSSKGVVKGKKAGKTKIVVTSKKNSKKKATITVVVKKKATQKVTLNQKNANLPMGQTLQLNASVTAKNGASKKVYWTSSNTNVATVSQTGIVTPVKQGTATITVTATDGSKKKATCKVNVVAKEEETPAPAPQPAPVTTNISAVSVKNYRTICVTLDNPCALTMADIKVMTKWNGGGEYRNAIQPTGLTTADKINYTIEFFGEDYLEFGEYIRVEIAKLDGAVKSQETQYIDKLVAYTGESVYTATVGHDYSDSICFGQIDGYSSFVVKNLPAGLSYNVNRGYLYIYGTPTKSGVQIATIEATDEYGNTYTEKSIFCIGDTNYLSAAVADVYAVMGSSYAYIQRSISVVGGSGSYTFAKVDDASGLSVDSSGNLKGNITVPGDYKVVVNVTDKNNAALTTQTTINVHVEPSVQVTGDFKILNGDSYYDTVYYTFTNNDRNTKYSSHYGSSTNYGSFSINIPAGTWDVEVSTAYGDVFLYFDDVKLTQDTKLSDIILPLATVNIVPPNGTDDYSKMYWVDANGETVGYGSRVYLKAGTYTLTADKNKSDLLAVLNTLTVNVTVADKTVQVAPTVTPNTVSFNEVGEGTYQVALGAGERQYVKFVPTETAQYKFYSTSSRDTYGHIYNASGKQLAYNDDDGDGNNFLITTTLVAGETYYLCSRFLNSSSSGSFDSTIEKVVAAE